MAGNIAAPLKGQEYQWLYGWLRCLDFIGPKRPIDVVHVENPAAGFFDDVTITPASDSVWPAQFVQVKFHVRQDGAFSFEDYASTENVKGGLLYKAWTSWQWLRDEHPTAEILLVSPWQWSTDDPVIPDNSRWPTDFINGSVTGAKLDARQSWSSVLGDPDEAEFSAFLSAMRFRLGHDDLSDLEDRCLNQMRVCG